jgi:hypothetical protein
MDEILTRDGRPIKVGDWVWYVDAYALQEDVGSKIVERHYVDLIHCERLYNKSGWGRDAHESFSTRHAALKFLRDLALDAVVRIDSLMAAEEPIPTPP